MNSTVAAYFLVDPIYQREEFKRGSLNIVGIAFS